MTRALAHVLGGGLTLSGAVMLVLHGLLLFGTVGDIGGPREVSGLAGFGAAMFVAGLLVEASLVRRRGRDLVRSMRFPPVWLSAALFLIVTGVGAVLVWRDAAQGVEPFLVVLGMALLFFGIIRLATSWAPARRAPGYVILRSTAWGMLGATTLAIVMQLTIAGVAIAGVGSGLYIADPDLLDGFLDRVGEEGSLDEFTGEIAGTVTVAIGIVSMYALVAPLTEEFTKFLGVVLAMRGRELTPYTVFVAGICSGLGFAVVETMGYALASGESWPLLMAIRGPVALVHVTGTTLLAFGWYLQRTRGGFPLVWYYIVAVGVHGAWNGLTASMLVAASGVNESADPSVSVLLAVLGVLGLLGFTLMACVWWIVANARHWGRQYQSAQAIASVVPSSLPPPVNRVTVISGTAPGEV